jgi:DNA-binding transcriptional ArsR family regulator
MARAASGARDVSKERSPEQSEAQAFTDIALKAIAEPRRRQILRLVRDAEVSAGEIASHFDVTRPAVSQHLGVLKEAGLVDERRNGTQRLYRARPQGIADLMAFLDDFWGDRLAALKREAEREERRKHEERD